MERALRRHLLHAQHFGDGVAHHFFHARRHGQGTFTFAYGDRYVGEYQHNQPHGLGTYTFNTGERYLGEFRNGIKEGQGSWFTPDGRVSLDPEGKQMITIAQLVNSQAEGLATPPEWDYEKSLSRSFGFVTEVQNPAAGLRFLRHENGIDVYWNDLTGKEVFVGRASRIQGM